MPPAYQRFGTHHGAHAHVHLGLQVQGELLFVQCVAHALGLLAQHLHRPVLHGIEQVKAVAPRLFGRVHGLVGMAQQGVGIGVV